ncbi:unnamed protein product [Mytilus edulis]|uniref:PHD-type domain-containing protein n=1 Tax=Mytilus edulis TaxID=6550 RepID=A0A8S3UAK5_MYTED|nr:unnamed protein product [Mytilus edulis]
MAPGVVGSLFTLLVFSLINRLTPDDIILNHQNHHGNKISCETFIVKTGKQVILNDFVLDSLYPRYDFQNINGGHTKIIKPTRKVTNIQSYFMCLLLILSGDISLNPGPTKFPCGICSKAVRKNQRGILCDECQYWFHVKCIDLPVAEYNILSQTSDSWYCKSCTLPQFTNSFFDISLEEKSNAPSQSYLPSSPEETSDVNTVFSHLRNVRKLHPRNFITAYLNINSIRYKFDEIKEILTDKIVDLLFIAETKLDVSFNDSLFESEGYKLYRRDRNANGGGILSIISSDIPSSRKINLECETIENISHEVYINDRKWLIMGMYKPPSMTGNTFSESFSKNLDKITVKYDNYIVLGDLNFDMLISDKCQPLSDICDIFDLDQLVKEPTCFKKDCRPSLVDVILTNKKSSCFKTLNFPTGISDCHNFISTTVKGQLPQQQNEKIIYRSYKNFDIDNFKNDIAKIKIEIVDGVTTAEQY